MRAFIIGNGPSLASTPLDKLSGEVTFATGRINLIYPDTLWRPTYYVLAERREQINEYQTRGDLRQIVDRHDTYTFIQAGLAGLIGHMRGFETFTTCLCALKKRPPQTWHLPQICSYGSSVHVAMQIAAMMEYSPLILLGCDLDGGHFDENYGESLVQTDLWRNAHEIAKRSCPVPVFNATIGGSLEVYERIDLCLSL